MKGAQTSDGRHWVVEKKVVALHSSLVDRAGRPSGHRAPDIEQGAEEVPENREPVGGQRDTMPHIDKQGNTCKG